MLQVYFINTASQSPNIRLEKKKIVNGEISECLLYVFSLKKKGIFLKLIHREFNYDLLF